jgi:hypothetical protein
MHAKLKDEQRKLNAGICFSTADPIASERLANGVGF